MRIRDWFIDAFKPRKRYIYIDDNNNASIIEVSGDTITQKSARKLNNK